MIWPNRSTVLLALFVAATSGTALFLHHGNAQLRAQIAQLRGRSEAAALLKSAEARRHELELLAGVDKDRAAIELRAKIARARANVAELEARALARYEQQTGRAAHMAEKLASNHDPRQGLVRLENYERAGQATPTAAFQTLVWATMKGDEPTLANLFHFSPTARTKAEAWIASLPNETQPQWTPEKLAALLFADLLTPVPAIQITGETLNDVDTATVRLRLSGDDEERVKFRLTAAGWRLLVSDSQIEKAKKRIAIIPAGTSH